MIVTFILILFANLWEFAFQVFPTGHIPQGMLDAIDTTISWVWVANIVLDVNTLFTIVGLYFVFELSTLLIEFFFWVYSKIPIFGKGK